MALNSIDVKKCSKEYSSRCNYKLHNKVVIEVIIWYTICMMITLLNVEQHPPKEDIPKFFSVTRCRKCHTHRQIPVPKYADDSSTDTNCYRATRWYDHVGYRTHSYAASQRGVLDMYHIELARLVTQKCRNDETCHLVPIKDFIEFILN